MKCIFIQGQPGGKGAMTPCFSKQIQFSSKGLKIVPEILFYLEKGQASTIKRPSSKKHRLIFSLQNFVFGFVNVPHLPLIRLCTYLCYTA